MAISSKDPIKRVGVIMPPPNPTVEPEYHAALPSQAFLYSARFPVQQGDLAQRNEGYHASYEQCVKAFRPMHIDAFVISCTGSNYIKGHVADRELNRRLSEVTGVPTMTSTGVILQALEELGVKGITLISPYPDWLTRQSADFWKGAGYRLDDVVQFGEGDHNIAYLLDDDYVEAQLRKLPPGKPDSVVLMTGTGMPTIGAISRLQRQSSVPLLSSNLCGVWWLLRQTGFKSGSAEFNEAALPLMPLL